MDVEAGKRKIKSLVEELKKAELAGDVAKVRLLKARIDNLRARVKKVEDEEKEDRMVLRRM